MQFTRFNVIKSERPEKESKEKSDPISEQNGSSLKKIQSKFNFDKTQFEDAFDEIFVFQPDQSVLNFNGEGRSNSEKGNSLFFFNKNENGEPTHNITETLQNYINNKISLAKDLEFKSKNQAHVGVVTFSLKGVNYGFNLPKKVEKETKQEIPFTEIESIDY